MTVRELQDRHNLNARILSSPKANTSSYAQRVTAEQAAVESRLIELLGVESINTGLRKTTLRGEGDMIVDPPLEPPTSRAIEAKRKALAQFGRNAAAGTTVTMAMDEAMELERAAFLRDKQRAEEKTQRQVAATATNPALTREERKARIWAFMTYKPSESDMEDDDDDSDDEDPANWFEDDQDDGRKGQDIVEPDDEDYSDIIRVDASRVQYSTFYEPRDEGD